MEKLIKYEYNQFSYSTYHFADEIGKLIYGEKYKRLNSLVAGELLVPISNKNIGYTFLISKVLEISSDKNILVAEGYITFVRGSLNKCVENLDSRTETPVLEKTKKIINLKKGMFFSDLEKEKNNILIIKNNIEKKIGVPVYR